MSSFAYQPLDRIVNRPSIRLAVLQPGDRDDPIKINLKHTTFAEKPKYESLSYTWGSASNAKSIEVNGTVISVRRNLDRALRHFRQKDGQRVLWIDAICINQADDAEKSWQVKLMADIYRRARRVLVWLGTVDAIEAPRPKPPPRRISLTLRPREERVREVKTQEEKDLEEAEYHRVLCSKPYWTRVWIVQEVGAAADLEIHWDIKSKISKKLISRSESWNDFFGEKHTVAGATNRAAELAKQREGRHGDAFLLANLIEASADALCELPHDKIYGFVAIAHDCEDGSFPVDYGKSLWKLYEDVVRFQCTSSTSVASKSLVHFSELIRKVLKQAIAPPENLWTSPMNPGRCDTCFGHVEDGTRLFKISTMHVGNVSIIGPSYDDLAGNPSVRRAWNLALKECESDATILREENDTFLSTILELDASELQRSATNIRSFAWRYFHDATGASRISRICYPRSVPRADGIPERALRLFATSEGTIGVIPSHVQKGDMLFRPWKSDVVVVVRAQEDETWRIIGRALLAKQKHTDEMDFELISPDLLGGLYLDVFALYDLTG